MFLIAISLLQKVAIIIFYKGKKINNQGTSAKEWR